MAVHEVQNVLSSKQTDLLKKRQRIYLPWYSPCNIKDEFVLYNKVLGTKPF